MSPIDPDAVQAALAQHRQEHEPATGAAHCACGGWRGPYTMVNRDDSYAAHLTAALAPLLVDAERAIRQDERARVVAAVEAAFEAPAYAGDAWIRKDAVSAALRESGGES